MSCFKFIQNFYFFETIVNFQAFWLVNLHDLKNLIGHLVKSNISVKFSLPCSQSFPLNNQAQGKFYIS